MSNPKQKEIFILLLCLFIGFALRFYTFDRKSLWLDEIYTFQDSRDGFGDQLKFYKENPTYLHPPLFFILTHQFYPFTKPERDLRIIPLIFGILSIPMIYLLAKEFSSSIALPCTLSLTFMTYHVSLSQDGRSYSLLMFFGMTVLYFFLKNLKTQKRIYLILVAFFFSILFYTSYSSIPFIVFSQILWIYQPSGVLKKPNLSSVLTLNGLIFLSCIPWVLFIVSNLKGGPLMVPLHTEDPGSLWNILYGVLHDWLSNSPLIMISVALFILFPFFSKFRENALFHLGVFILPIGAIYLFCKMFNFTHYVTSRYLINFLPLFFITLFLSLSAIESRFQRLKAYLRLKLLFVTLLIASNLMIFPLYYRSEKQDFRGLVHYLMSYIKEDDKIIVGTKMYFHGLLHYFGVEPQKGREYLLAYHTISTNELEDYIVLIFMGKKFTISHSKTQWIRYLREGTRVWLVVDKKRAKEIIENYPFSLRGYFDGSYLNFIRFPTDVSMYLLLWDPSSPEEKGIEMPLD